MNEVIKQILDTACLLGKEREACRKFLAHIYGTKDPALAARAEVAKTDKFQLDCLLGDYWETMFCDQAASMGFPSYLTQRYKLFAPARASMFVRVAGKERIDYDLPDTLLFLPGKGPVASFDIKHERPFQLYPVVSLNYYEERVKLFGSSLPYYYALHTYLPFNFKEWKGREFQGWGEYWSEHSNEYRDAKKWSLNSRTGWLAVRVLPDMPLERHGGWPCASLGQFEPLKQALKKLG